MQFKSKYIRQEFADKKYLPIIAFLERLSTILKVWLIVGELILTSKLAVPNTFIASPEADCKEIGDFSKLTDGFKDLKMRS